MRTKDFVKHWWKVFLILGILFVGGSAIMLHQLVNQKAQQQVISQLGSPLSLGAVTLQVRNLAALSDFYVSQVGLEVLSQSEEEVILGSQGRPVLVLVSAPHLRFASPGSAGLYHTAILFSSQARLASVLQTFFQTRPELFQGSSDHIVSEAFYFVDPEGNGLELYFDRPAETWQWQDGRVQMGSSYIDPNQYIAQHAVASGNPDQTMGHIHLRVGDIQMAKNFYVDILGFEITSEHPTALFVSDGMYHHHIGMNVWESAGAGIREETLGLRRFEMFVPSDQKIQELSRRLRAADVSFSEGQGSLSVSDPWGNEITFLSKE